MLIRWIGAAPAAALLRILQGATVVGMGLLAGPVGVLVAYFACYAVHGASNPLHMGLLHRQVDGPYRTSVLSLNSMVAAPGFALGGIALTALAGAATVGTAMLVGAVVLAVAAPLYLPAGRANRTTAPSGAADTAPFGDRPCLGATGTVPFGATGIGPGGDGPGTDAARREFPEPDRTGESAAAGRRAVG